MRLAPLACAVLALWISLCGRGAQASQPTPQALASGSGAEPLDDGRMRLVWRPTSVAWPLLPLGAATGEAEGLAAHLDEWLGMQAGEIPAPSVRGVVDLDQERAVGVWISALESVRVRQLGAPVPLRFIRVADDHTAVIEAGRSLAPGPELERRWALDQPPSVGALWSIEADAPTQVMIERVEERAPRYVSVELEHELLDWIEAEPAPMPPLFTPGDDTHARLELQTALARELQALGPTDAKLMRAIEAWRTLAALETLDRGRPAVRPYHVRERGASALEGTRALALAGVESRSYQLAEPRSWTLSQRGPGQLRIAARAWAPAGQELAPAELRVRAGGRVIARLRLPGRPAMHALDPDTALPQFEPLLDEQGNPVGEFAEHTVVLAPGRHDYELELSGGPALLDVELSRRVESSLASLRGRTPAKRARAVARQLAKSEAEAAEWLALLACEQTLTPLPILAFDPRFDALAERSPLLAITGLSLAASDERLDERAVAELFERVRPWFAALDRDGELAPVVRGQLRTRWLALLLHHELYELAVELTPLVSGGAQPTELPVAGLRLLAEAQAMIPLASRERASTLALLELALRRAPGDAGLRAQMLHAWSSSSRWSLLSPRAHDGARLEPRGGWLVPHAATLRPLASERRWLELEPGAARRIRARVGAGPSDDETQRMSLLDIYVASMPGARDPVRLRVDDNSWWSPQLFGVQRHRIAVLPGVHEVQFEGPPGTRAWSSLPSVDPHDDSRFARREQLWELPDSSWALPGPAVQGYLRLRLRWPADLEPRPVRVELVVDDENASPQTILFDPRSPAAAGAAPASVALDEDAVPLSGAPAVSFSEDVLLPISAATSELRFAVEDDIPLLASLSVRRGLRSVDLLVAGDEVGGQLEPRSESLFADLAELGHDHLLSELASLSATLLEAPRELDARARRAALLLTIGETGLARADLMVLTALFEALSPSARRRQQQLLTELEERFDAFIEPREIISTQQDARAGPLLIEPAIAAVAGENRADLEAWLDTWAAARELPVDEAIATLDAQRERLSARELEPEAQLLGELARLHWQTTERSGARENSRGWLELYGRLRDGGAARAALAVGVAAVGPLLDHLDDPASDARDAGAAYGLARALIPSYGHTRVRRLAFIAALRSSWLTVNHAVRSPGFERLELPVSELERSAMWQVREALMLPPWAASESHQLRPQRKGVLTWDATPGSVEVELWCRALRPDLAPLRVDQIDTRSELGSAELRVRLRGDEGEVLVDQRVEVGDASSTKIELPILAPARHRLELLLADDPMWMCNWRAMTRAESSESPQPLESRQRAQWWSVESNHSVEFVVLGPTSLRVESRAIITPDVEQRPTLLRAEVDGVLEESPLAGGLERAVLTEHRRRFKVARAGEHTLLLTEPRAYHVRLTTDRGRALVRVRTRRDRGDIPPPAQFSMRELIGASEDPEQGSEARSYRPTAWARARDMPATAYSRLGTLSAFVRAGLDELGDNDEFRLRFGVLHTLGWRRELLEDTLWLRASAQIRMRERSPVAGGGIVALGARVPVLGLRLGASVDALSHRFGAQPEASVRLTTFIDRPIRLGPFMQLRPRLDAGIRWQSLTAARVSAAGEAAEPHPRVYLPYVEQHPLLLRPELGLRAFPLQDLALSARVSAFPNSDLRSLDHVNIDLGLDGIGRQPQPWLPFWAVGYQASTRFADAHREQSFVRHRIDAELGVAVWSNDLARFMLGARNTLYLRQDAPFRDVFEIWLRVDATLGRRMRDFGPGDLWFRELWAPRGWGDSEAQAQSTRGRISASK